MMSLTPGFWPTQGGAQSNRPTLALNGNRNLSFKENRNTTLKYIGREI